MPKTYVFLVFVLLIISCSDTNHNESYQDVQIKNQESVMVEDELKVEAVEEIDEERTFGSIEIAFAEFNFTIYNSSFYEGRMIGNSNKDTVSAYLELGEHLDSATIEIHHGGVHNIDIYQMYENSITIMNEGPHCDLINWKHYHSEWVAIKKHNNYDFTAETYTDSDWQKFIDVDVKELQDAVTVHCGKEWTEHINNIKKYNDYPCGVSMSRIFFKVILTNKQSGKITEKTITFEIPMGC